jgi:NAD(P)H-hydrate epimerase
MRLVSVEEMKTIEKSANEAGISNAQLMDNAGKGIAEFILDQFSGNGYSKVLGIVGKGNNGGDTLLALTYLLQAGWDASAVLINSRSDDPLMKAFVKNDGRIIHFTDKNFEANVEEALTPDTILLDGLLGTGIQLPLKADYSQLLSTIDDHCSLDQVIIAVDCPSGVDCNTGEMADEILFCDMTICLEAVKQGLLKEPAFEACGEIISIPLGLPEDLEQSGIEKIVVDDAWVEEHYLPRSEFGHKGTFGKVMVIGGSTNYFGAPVLAGLAAYRAGCGLVNLAVPHAVTMVMAGKVPEFTWLSLEDEDGVIAESAAELILKKVSDYNCLALGPGIGLEETTAHFLEHLFFQPDRNGRRKVGFLEGENHNALPVELPDTVIDADALRWLAKQDKWYEKLQTRMVLTPHPGEMAALTGIPIKEIQKDRQTVASHFAKTWHQVVVLKGALTVIAAPDGRIAVIPIASSALAKAGSGDVLTGIIASFIAQGQSLYEAAVLAAWFHANAGLEATHRIGSEASVLSSDIIDSIPDVFKAMTEE